MRLESLVAGLFIGAVLIVSSPRFAQAFGGINPLLQGFPTEPAPAPVAAPAPAPMPAPAPAPSASASPGQAPAGMDANQQQLFNLINGSRASAGLPPYTFSAVESNGTGGCPGSLGHSEHMALEGQISHDQFPQDICVSYMAAGENVGIAGESESSGIQTLHQEMMNEGPGGGHYQNIMSPGFNTVGIGLYYVNGTLWLTEDFTE